MKFLSAFGDHLSTTQEVTAIVCCAELDTILVGFKN